ncbi:cyclic peptide export ABC transporter [Sorangium sp. So ce1182]|uniref:cyclic peptide export ABC transporter n=1 Tax=Sorangium sp. So ce1182 TaxID=3133334 RepID=UPI003F5E72BB
MAESVPMATSEAEGLVGWRPERTEVPAGGGLLSALIRSSRGLLAAALITSLISGFCAAPLVALINKALNGESGALPALGWQFAGISVLVLLTRWVSQSLCVRLSQVALAQMRSHVSRQVTGAPYRHLELQGSARVLAILTEDIATLSQFFVSVPSLFLDGAVVLGCLIYLCVLSWRVFLFAALIVFVGSLGFHLANTTALRYLRSSRLHEDRLFQHFRSLFDGAKELKLHRARRAAFLSGMLDGSIEKVREERTRGLTIYVGAESWGSFLFFVFIGAVLFVFSRYFSVDTYVMSGYALVFLYMQLPMEAALRALPNISRARIALERIEHVTGSLSAEGVRSLAPQLPPFERLELRGVTHAYYREQEGRTFVLGPIDLELRPGEVVFLVGGNGSGKTTLAKIIVGLYGPEGGEILLNGAPVTEETRDGYRQLFSAVFSDFFLFDTLIGLEGGSLDERARKLLVELELSHKVTVRDGVLSTTELSQGQRKRLALLVSYLENRPVYVFDEWAADQDPAYREVFYRRLLPDLKARGKAVLAITHDDRYFHLADRCVKLEFGRLTPRVEGAEGADGADEGDVAERRAQAEAVVSA